MTTKKQADDLERELQGGAGTEVWVEAVEDTDREGDWFFVTFEVNQDEAKKLYELFIKLQHA